MIEPFLINPPRRLLSNPLGVDELAILNPPRKRRAKKRRGKVAIRRKRNSKGRFVKGGVKTKARRRRTSRKTTSRIRRAVRRSGVRRKVRTLRRRTVYVTNPRRRRSHARRTHRRSYRRNPGLGGLLSVGSIMPTLKEGAFIALGAVAVGHAMARLPYVSTLVGPTRHLARLAVAIFGGKLITKFLKQPALGRAFAMGGVVATALQLAAENFPALVPMSASDEMALGMYYASPMGLGEYYAAGPTVAGQPDGLSFEQDMPERLMQNRF
jgi:hypothetical protein